MNNTLVPVDPDVCERCEMAYHISGSGWAFPGSHPNLNQWLCKAVLHAKQDPLDSIITRDKSTVPRCCHNIEQHTKNWMQHLEWNQHA